MTQARWTAVDEYYEALFTSRDDATEAALQASIAAGIPPGNVSRNQGKLLMLLAQMQGAKNILEIGTLAGYSTLWMARALPTDGRLITLEVDPKFAEIARTNVMRAGMNRIIEIRVGAALDSLQQLVDENRGPFDFIFIDADKRNNPEYLKWSLRLSRIGTVIVADNVVRDGAVIDGSSVDPSVVGVRAMNEMMAAEPRLSAVAIQTVGIKGYDGFIVARVVSD